MRICVGWYLETEKGIFGPFISKREALRVKKSECLKYRRLYFGGEYLPPTLGFYNPGFLNDSGELRRP